MPTTRPGYIWSGTEWIAIGQEAVLAPVSYQATAPTSPATGDIWIESDVDVPSIDSSQFLRWRKTMAGGETSLSGNDDSSLSLAYTPGYEQLYINGVLQVRGGDYTATTGTTVTGLTALVANDVVEIFSPVAISVADVYTQTQSDARFVNRNVGGLNLVIPTAVTGGTINANGAITIGSAVSSVSISNAFSATYDAYRIVVSGGVGSTATALNAQLGNSGTFSGGDYAYYLQYLNYGGSTGSAGGTGQSSFANSGYMTTDYLDASYDIINPFLPKMTILKNGSWNWSGGTGFFTGQHKQSTSFADFRLVTGSGTMTGGTIRIYGYNNGV
jgi:hypothetical protein